MSSFSYSPNKFYDPPSTFSRNGAGIGFGKKQSFEKTDYIQPSRYVVASYFDQLKKKTPKFTTFGINREV